MRFIPLRWYRSTLLAHGLSFYGHNVQDYQYSLLINPSTRCPEKVVHLCNEHCGLQVEM